MDLASSVHTLSRPFSRWKATTLAVAALAVTACSQKPPEIPSPRPIVVRSGARLFPDKERLQEIDTWFRAQDENIQKDPSFMIETVPRDTSAYPWESLVIIPATRGVGIDTAKIGVEGHKSPEAGQAYMIYAHYHLMKEMGRLNDFLPGGDTLEAYALERAIVSRVSDVWLLGRAVYNAVAYDPLEEIMYSNEDGYLDAFLLTARGEEFGEERRSWLQQDPEALERYRSWFVETFEREPPGLRGKD